MAEIATIGLDIATSVFQIHGVDRAGQVVVRRQLRRSHVLECCSPRTAGHGQGVPRVAMNSRGERYPRALCGCTSL